MHFIDLAAIAFATIGRRSPEAAVKAASDLWLEREKLHLQLQKSTSWHERHLANEMTDAMTGSPQVHVSCGGGED